MRDWLRKLAVTIAYVTCIPLARIEEEEAGESLSGLAKFLPLAGAAIGLILLGTAKLLLLFHTSQLMLGTLLALVWLLITNGLHFDGLMDTADGIFSHTRRERMLEIMQDPRVGNFGVLAGVSVLLLKVVSLMTMPTVMLVPVLIVVPAASRWCETFAICAYSYAKPHGKGKIWHDSSSRRDLLPSLLVPLGLVAALCALGCSEALLPFALTTISGIAAAVWLNRKLDGHTGDTYGAVVEIAESAGLTGSAILLPALMPHIFHVPM